MKKRIKKILPLERLFKNELRRQIRMFITFALGFTIAFSWRETIFNLSKSLIKFFLNLKTDSTVNIFASLFITIISLIIIYIASYSLRDSPENYF